MSDVVLAQFGSLATFAGALSAAPAVAERDRGRCRPLAVAAVVVLLLFWLRLFWPLGRRCWPPALVAATV